MIRAMSKQAEVLKLPVAEPHETLEAQRLAESLAKIHADARTRARCYQDETIVPEGGE